MKRILVIGSGGAGKSTVSEELHKILHLPIIRLDEHYWRPGWVRPEHDEWKKKIKDLIQKDEWIMDGNYQPTLELRLSRADAIIFMDTPRLISLFRLLNRRFTKPKTEIAPGCVERLDRKFMSYIWRYEKTQRPKIIKLLEKYKGEKEIYVIHSKKEMWSFLKTLPKSF